MPLSFMVTIHTYALSTRRCMFQGQQSQEYANFLISLYPYYIYIYFFKCETLERLNMNSVWELNILSYTQSKIVIYLS